MGAAGGSGGAGVGGWGRGRVGGTRTRGVRPAGGECPSGWSHGGGWGFPGVDGAMEVGDWQAGERVPRYQGLFPELDLNQVASSRADVPWWWGPGGPCTLLVRSLPLASGLQPPVGLSAG